MCGERQAAGFSLTPGFQRDEKPLKRLTIRLPQQHRAKAALLMRLPLSQLELSRSSGVSMRDWRHLYFY